MLAVRILYDPWILSIDMIDAIFQPSSIASFSDKNLGDATVCNAVGISKSEIGIVHKFPYCECIHLQGGMGSAAPELLRYLV